MQKDEKRIFAEGFSFKRNDNAPDFVIGNISVNIESAMQYFDKMGDNGWVNFQVKLSQNGNYYCEHDSWKPNKDAAPKTKAVDIAPSNDDEDLPF
jgi:hypothetical protein